MKLTDLREKAWSEYNAWDGQYHASGYRGAFDAGFDRALAAHDAEVAAKAKEEGWDEGFEAGATWHPSHPSGVSNDPPLNPYRAARIEEEATDAEH